MTTHADYDPDFDADGFALKHRHSFPLRGQTLHCLLLSMDDRETFFDRWREAGGKESHMAQLLLEPDSYETFRAHANHPTAPLPATVIAQILNDLTGILIRGESPADPPKPESSSDTSEPNEANSTGV